MVGLFGTNETGIVAVFLDGMTQNVTGTGFLTILFIVLFLVVIALALRLSIEFTFVLIFPLILVAGAFTGELLGAVGVIALYLGLILAKNFLIR